MAGEGMGGVGGPVGLTQIHADLVGLAAQVGKLAPSTLSSVLSSSAISAHGVMLYEAPGIGTASIGTAGRLLIDQGAGADPSFNAMSGDATISSGGVIAVAKVSGVSYQYSGSPPLNTVPVVVSTAGSGTVTYETVPVAAGGTGRATLTANAVLLGEGLGGIGFATVATLGRILTDQGAGGAGDPVFSPNIALPSGGTAKLNPNVFYGTGSGCGVLNSSGIILMAGFGRSSANNWVFTPQIAGNINIVFSGDVYDSVAADSIVMQPRYADSAVTAAPSFGSSGVGTNCGPAHTLYVPVNGGQVTVTYFVRITGLSIAHNYWFDFGMSNSVSSLANMQIFNPSIFIEESFG